MSYLAETLKNYYRKKGNKIIFRNGMSLNQLAITMWERLGFREVDASVVSRVIHGERLFTASQLKTFCLILNVSKEQKEELFYFLHKDLFSQLGIKVDYFATDDFLDFVAESIKTIRSLEDAGNANFAYELAQSLSDILENRVVKKSIVRHTKKKTLELLARTTFEQGYAKVLWLPANLVGNETISYWKKVKKIGLRLRNKEIVGLSLLGLGHSSYVAEDYKNSLDFLTLGLGYTLNLEDRVMAYKVLGLGFAYEKEKNMFKKLEEHSKTVFASGEISLTRKCELFEGLGRGSALLDLPGSQNYIDLGQELVKKLRKHGPQDLFREIQLIRTKLEILTYGGRSERKIDKTGIEREGLKGILLASRLGYIRHEQKLKKFLSSVLQ